MRRLKGFGYKNMWSTWIQRNMYPTMAAKVNKTFNTSLIVSTAAHLSIKINWKKFGSYDITTGKSGFNWNPMNPCRGQESAWRPFSAFSEFFSGVLQSSLLKTSQMVTPYVNYQKLTFVAKIFVPNTTRHPKIASVHVCKTMRISTR